jgi:hypothetical protein
MDLCLPTYFRNDGYLRNGSLLVTLRMEVQSTNHIWKVTTLNPAIPDFATAMQRSCKRLPWREE